MRNVYFRRPLTILDEKEEGYLLPYSFIVYGRRPWLFKNVAFTGVGVNNGDIVHDIMSVPVQYRYVLKIDLWLCVLDFRWYGKVKDI